MTTGLLGKWEFADETINSISDLLPKCCEFFEFNPDNSKQDLKGLFVYTDSLGDTYNGEFVVDYAYQIIIFQRQEKQLVCGFSLNSSKNYLTLMFTEGNSSFVQGWVKRN